MKRETDRGHQEIYRLPNHSWLPLDWVPVNSQFDTPEHVIRRTSFGVLVRSTNWEKAKRKNYNYTSKFLGQSNPNGTWSSLRLYLTGENIIGILRQRAETGNAEAAMELARLAADATEDLNKICVARPELFRPLARVRRAWPVIKKRNANLSNGERDLFTAIQLGADDFVELDPQTAKWKMDDAGKIALGLLRYLRACRGLGQDAFNNGEISKYLREKLPSDFADKNSLVWWTTAKKLLLFSYPEPEKIDEFKQILSASQRSKRYPSQIRQAILEVVKKRFLSFAPNRA